ncbi:tetratricopeptide repeat protein [Lentilactobacillus kisonensis]|nr:hypothetical protein [Lentilactobacillus kisonensis]
MTKDTQQELFKQINQAQPEKLKNLILRLASLDDNLAGLILGVLNDEPVQASQPQRREVKNNAIEKEIHHIRGVIANTILENGGDTDCFKPQQAKSLIDFFDGLVDEIQNGIESGDMPIELSVPLLLMTYQNQIQLLPKIVDYNQQFDDSVQGTMLALEEAVDSVAGLSTDIKDNLMDQVIKLFKKAIFEGFPEERYDLFYTALPLVTEQTAPKLIAVSEKLKKQVSIMDMLYLESNKLLLQIRIAFQLGQTKRAQQIIDDNIDNEDVRSEYVAILEGSKNFPKAEAVIQDAINKKLGDPQQWRNRLARIYRQTNQTAKLRKLLKNQLLSGDIEAYDQYRELLVGMHEWKKEYPALLATLAAKLGRYDYCKILLKENAYSKIVDQLNKYKSMAMIRQYAPIIYKYEKKPITTLYLNSVVIPQSNKKTATGPVQLASDIIKFLNFSKDLKTTKRVIKQLKVRLGTGGRFRDAFSKIDDAIERFELNIN